MESTLGTITDEHGKILYFSPQDFIERIVLEGNCFVCGAAKGQKVFNNEHIFPNWLLTQFDLHHKTITLPNGARSTYSKYKIPCCQECNTLLSKNMEIPLSTLLKLSYVEFIREIQANTENLHLLFEWCVLIYLKSHLKDMAHNWNLKHSDENFKMGEIYDWAEHHHLHCVMRRFYTGAKTHPRIYGSMCIFPVFYPKGSTIGDQFDYISDILGQTVMIRIGQVALICVLNDAGAAQLMFSNYLQKITAPLTQLQLREVFSHLAYLNTNLKQRPKFYSLYNKAQGRLVMSVQVPEFLDIIEEENEIISLGDILYKSCVPVMGEIKEGETEKNNILSAIKSGGYTFLFDNDQTFIDHARLQE